LPDVLLFKSGRFSFPVNEQTHERCKRNYCNNDKQQVVFFLPKAGFNYIKKKLIHIYKLAEC
jgi:hypothetical protein